MGRFLNRVSATTAATPGRRSLRNSKPAEENVKVKAKIKARKPVVKKKEDSVEKKNEEEKTEKKDTEAANPEPDAPKASSEADVEEIPADSKPATSRSVKAGRKRQASESAIVIEEEDKDAKESSDDKNNVELKNGKTDAPPKGNVKRKKKKPPTKKKKEQPDEAEMWTPLEPLGGDEKKDTQRKPQSKSDRRKQALVERQAPAEPMLQKQPIRQRKNSDATECVVLNSRMKTIVTVDIDDEASETGSIQIVAEPDVDSVFDFKRLLIQYRNVNLPSSLWGVHKDPRNQFVSFTRFNPDYPDTHGIFVDRAVVFKGSLNPEVFVNGEKVEIPEMFNVVETLLETSQVIQFMNNTVSVMSHTREEPSNEDG